MNPKKLITAALLVFVAASLGYMTAREKNSQSLLASRAGVSSEIDLPDANQQVMVYYFHGDVRCPTCHKLENYAKEALDTYFADNLAAGKIRWKPTNVDTPANEHFVKDYKLVTKSVIVSRMVNGQEVAWKNLDQIWELVSDKDKYLTYIRDSVKKFTAEEQK